MKFITRHSDLGKEPIAKQVMDPREEPITIILRILNQLQLTYNSHRLIHFSMLPREASIY